MGQRTARPRSRFGNLSAAEQVAAARRQLESHRFTMEIVRRRRKDPGDDLISWMVQESDASDDPLTDEQLAAQVTDLLTAGHETSAYFLTMLIRRVVTDRPLWAQLADDDELRTAVILRRCASRDRPTRCGATPSATPSWERSESRPAHESRLVLGSANLDDAVFDKTDAFEVSRSNAASYLAFGRGIHTCVGAGVARMEARVSWRSCRPASPTCASPPMTSCRSDRRRTCGRPSGCSSNGADPGELRLRPRRARSSFGRSRR